jgi:hypothetical protein
MRTWGTMSQAYPSRATSTLAALALTAAAATHLIGCGCGAVPSPNQTYVMNGAVTFPSVAVGSSMTVSVNFQDSANTSETITAATISGADAADFQVVSTFPMAIPQGEQVAVEIEFSPTQAGSASATLTLQTEKMGPSPVKLEGTGVNPGG